MSGQIGKKELSEEESLCELFRKCDGSYNTGQVRAQDLLSALKVRASTCGLSNIKFVTLAVIFSEFVRQGCGF